MQPMLQKFLGLFLLGFIHFAYKAQALSPSVEKLVYFETKANEGHVRNTDKIRIPHFEIPLSMLEVDFAETMPIALKDLLIFKKGGVPYVRWILNPEDTVWHLEVKEYFQTKGLNLTKKYFFTDIKHLPDLTLSKIPIKASDLPPLTGGV